MTHQYSKDESQVSRNMIFHAVTSGSDENKTFWKYTPSGEIKMQVVNDEACKLFEIGKEYYVDFIPTN